MTRLYALFPLVAAAIVMASPARADRCDDLARQLKDQVDGLSIGRSAANVIYLAHPAAKQVRLGCAGRNVSNEFYAAADSRKPSPAFINMIASGAAIVFTIPKPDTLKGAQRCFGRLGLLRGEDVKLRFRRLDIRCTRSKTSTSIAISRGTDG